LLRNVRYGTIPSRDCGPWSKLLQVQDVLIVDPQRYVAAKGSIELVLEASKKAIPDNIEKLRIHEKVMRNYMDMYEQAKFSPKGSSEDKHLKEWGVRALPNSRQQSGIKPTISTVWDQVLAAYMSTSGAWVEKVENAI
jgi:hypothetical protein